MAGAASMCLVGTIRSIELHTLVARFEHVTPRQVAKISLDVERATDDDGEDLDVGKLNDLSFQGPAELVPRFNAGDRVQITTDGEAGFKISSIKPAPLS